MSHTEPPVSTDRTALRRKDRGVTDEAWIRAFLQRAPVGVMALAAGEQPYTHMNLFYYDEAAHAIYFHMALHGRTRELIEANPRVCFSVMEMGRLLPASTALEFSVEYASVTAFGRARVVTERVEAERALQWLLDKYAPHLTPGVDYRPPVESEIARTTAIAIHIEEWIGKKKEVGADFPGAYWYAAPPMLASLGGQRVPGRAGEGPDLGRSDGSETDSVY